MLKSFFFYKCNMNICQNFYLTLSLMRGSVWCWQMFQRRIQKEEKHTGIRNVEQRFTNRGKTGQCPQGKISCIPGGTICISMNKNHLHCYLFPTIYRAVKSPKDREVWDNAEETVRQDTQEALWFKSKPLRMFLFCPLFSSNCFVECSQPSGYPVNIS